MNIVVDFYMHLLSFGVYVLQAHYGWILATFVERVLCF